MLLYAGHTPAMHPELRVWENLAFDAAWRGRGIRRAQACEALAATGMLEHADRPARLLSEGQRRRAWLARLALADGIPLWLLDEPFSALDQAAGQQVLDLLRAHLARGNMIVFSTHAPGALAASQRLALGNEEARC